MTKLVEGLKEVRRLVEKEKTLLVRDAIFLVANGNLQKFQDLSAALRLFRFESLDSAIEEAEREEGK
jgi:hypothetical protein